ncbi:MAG: peptidylprolyl isomerase [Clostridiales bacterium GWE2_32_10]|nr:MAG: peptidylprolyl isomerase [Clostridiales bacterium GWE2_32_10]
MEFVQFEKPTKGEEIAVMTTSMGDIKIRLFPQFAPKAVENFVTHAKEGYYNNLTFHRVMNEFMIQGGDPSGNGTGGESIWGAPFEDEFSEKILNFRGALSMANAGANTNGSQFFIVQAHKVGDDLVAAYKKQGVPEEFINAYIEHGGTPWLDGKHTVFGQVLEGLDIVDNIAKVEVDKNDKPLENVMIKTISVEKYGE